jgi:hypothetical protein
MNKPVSLDDANAINDLLARYCWYFDEGRGEEWAGLYAEDGVLEGSRPEPVRGRAALASIAADSYARFGGRLRHHHGNVYLEYGEDVNAVIARFYNQVSTWTGGGGGVLLMMAISTATLVRSGRDGSWRIRKNSVVMLR